jgi:hypothetical protein
MRAGVLAADLLQILSVGLRLRTDVSCQVIHFISIFRLWGWWLVAAGLLLSPPQSPCILRFSPQFSFLLTGLPAWIGFREALTESVPCNF